MATKGIIIDAVASLPKNAGGVSIRIVEGTFGHDHQHSFKAFLASGGILGASASRGLSTTSVLADSDRATDPS